MAKLKNNARPDRMIYVALLASILVGCFLYSIAVFLKFTSIESLTLIDLLLRFCLRYFVMVVIAILGLLPVWFFFGIICYFVVGLFFSSTSKKLLVAIAYGALVALYRFLIFVFFDEKLVTDFDLLLTLTGPIFFIVPAVVVIYNIKWLDIKVTEADPGPLKYDDILDK